MTGTREKTAIVGSTNAVEFSFPYSGSQNAYLMLRTGRRNSTDVMLGIQKGQILCPAYQGGRVQVRFDEEQPAYFTANPPSDHSSTLIFLGNEARFMSKLKKAKRVRMSVNIYHEGSPVFEFDVSGFESSTYEAKS